MRRLPSFFPLLLVKQVAAPPLVAGRRQNNGNNIDEEEKSLQNSGKSALLHATRMRKLLLRCLANLKGARGTYA